MSAYVHIPFCRQRCYYCDFPISVVGNALNGRNSGTIAHYINVLCQEIQNTPATVHPLETVFLGGGTPSLLSVGQLARILTTLDQQFGIASTAEISMEIDPGTFDLAQVQGYKAAGVNRVSLGVQAFQPELLQVCGRSHTVTEIYTAIDLLRQTGFENISLDLISGLPHQTLAQWQDSLEQAIALAPRHLSCYDLTVEPTTPFSRQYKPGMAPLPSDETTAEMYRTAQRLLTGAGYTHYEISNYAKPGYQCRHNRVYWETRPFYGFGMGATSYLNGDRVARPRKTQEYYAWVEEQIQTGKMQLESEPDRSPNEQLLDTLMLGLRLAEGLAIEDLRSRFGPTKLAQIWQCLQRYAQQGWVAVLPQRSPETQPDPVNLPEFGRIRLTDPEGFLFSNVVLVALFETLE